MHKPSDKTICDGVYWSFNMHLHFLEDHPNIPTSNIRRRNKSRKKISYLFYTSKLFLDYCCLNNSIRTFIIYVVPSYILHASVRSHHYQD